MAARELISKRVKLNLAVLLFIYPRLGGEAARIYSVHPSSPDDIALYEQNLYPANDAEGLPCSARSIVYCPTIVAGVIASRIKRFALGQAFSPEVLVDAGRSLIKWARCSPSEVLRSSG